MPTHDRLPVTVLSGSSAPGRPRCSRGPARGGRAARPRAPLRSAARRVDRPLRAAAGGGTFTFADEAGRSLADVARLDTLVTVVDAGSFLRDLGSVEDLRDRGETAGPDDERSLVDLLVDQVEFADVLVLNKADLVEPDELAQVEAVVRSLNRHARVVHAVRGRVGLGEVLDTGRFSFEQAARSAGWLAVLRGDEQPETEEYGITSFVYRARRPFHPVRLRTAVNQPWPGVIRSKGFFWLATRPAIAAEWSTAGGVLHLGAAGAWWTAVDLRLWPHDPEARAEIAAQIQPPWG